MVALVPGSPHGTLGYLHHAVRVQRAFTQLSGVPGMGTGPRLTAPAKRERDEYICQSSKQMGTSQHRSLTRAPILSHSHTDIEYH